MAIYSYDTNKKKGRFQDVVALIGAAFYFSLFFVVPSINRSEIDPAIVANMSWIMALLFIVMCLIPMVKMARRKKNGATTIETTRKGLVLTLLDKKQIIAWKDLYKSTIIYDSSVNKLFPRKFILKYGEKTTVIDNEPYGNGLLDAVKFAEELSENVPTIRQQVIGLHNVCPWCGPFENSRKCTNCKANIQYVPRLHKIFYIIKIDIILALITGMLMGKTFFIVSAVLFVILIILPTAWALHQDYTTIPPNASPGKTGKDK